ncbi:hypothetical protein PR048_026031 [Dryococelus australis]|uniref:Uncharacterized protein n=1 Tax=Dryococelus australis TaxID=614101 RepID=A0ABQ9GK94_9NEOP|nr:hypothetical protein PR048_026031 [Dryococelus australis]
MYSNEAFPTTAPFDLDKLSLSRVVKLALSCTSEVGTGANESQSCAPYAFMRGNPCKRDGIHRGREGLGSHGHRDEHTTCIQTDLKQGFQKCSFYREKPIERGRISFSLICLTLDYGLRREGLDTLYPSRHVKMTHLMSPYSSAVCRALRTHLALPSSRNDALVAVALPLTLLRIPCMPRVARLAGVVDLLSPARVSDTFSDNARMFWRYWLAPQPSAMHHAIFDGRRLASMRERSEVWTTTGDCGTTASENIATGVIWTELSLQIPLRQREHLHSSVCPPACMLVAKSVVEWDAFQGKPYTPGLVIIIGTCIAAKQGYCAMAAIVAMDTRRKKKGPGRLMSGDMKCVGSLLERIQGRTAVARPWRRGTELRHPPADASHLSGSRKKMASFQVEKMGVISKRKKVVGRSHYSTASSVCAGKLTRDRLGIGGGNGPYKQLSDGRNVAAKVRVYETRVFAIYNDILLWEVVLYLLQLSLQTRSPSTKVNRIQFPMGSLPDFCAILLDDATDLQPSKSVHSTPDAADPSMAEATIPACSIHVLYVTSLRPGWPRKDVDRTKAAMVNLCCEWAGKLRHCWMKSRMSDCEALFYSGGHCGSSTEASRQVYDPSHNTVAQLGRNVPDGGSVLFIPVSNVSVRNANYSYTSNSTRTLIKLHASPSCIRLHYQGCVGRQYLPLRSGSYTLPGLRGATVPSSSQWQLYITRAAWGDSTFLFAVAVIHYQGCVGRQYLPLRSGSYTLPGLRGATVPSSSQWQLYITRAAWGDSKMAAVPRTNFCDCLTPLRIISKVFGVDTHEIVAKEANDGRIILEIRRQAVVINWVCSSTSREARKTTGIIHDLLLQPGLSKEASEQLKEFSLQTSRRKIVFSAGGFVTLGLPLLSSIGRRNREWTIPPVVQHSLVERSGHRLASVVNPAGVVAAWQPASSCSSFYVEPEGSSTGDTLQMNRYRYLSGWHAVSCVLRLGTCCSCAGDENVMDDIQAAMHPTAHYLSHLRDNLEKRKRCKYCMTASLSTGEGVIGACVEVDFPAGKSIPACSWLWKHGVELADMDLAALCVLAIRRSCKFCRRTVCSPTTQGMYTFIEYVITFWEWHVLHSGNGTTKKTMCAQTYPGMKCSRNIHVWAHAKSPPHARHGTLSALQCQHVGVVIVNNHLKYCRRCCETYLLPFATPCYVCDIINEYGGKCDDWGSSISNRLSNFAQAPLESQWEQKISAKVGVNEKCGGRNSSRPRCQLAAFPQRSAGHERRPGGHVNSLVYEATIAIEKDLVARVIAPFYSVRTTSNIYARVQANLVHR